MWVINREKTRVENLETGHIIFLSQEFDDRQVPTWSLRSAAVVNKGAARTVAVGYTSEEEGLAAFNQLLLDLDINPVVPVLPEESNSEREVK